MFNWLDSVYSDGSSFFVSNPAPSFGETVRIRLRMAENSPVNTVILRSIPNGGELHVPMHICRREKGLIYWEAELPMLEKRMQYEFYLACDDAIYYYTQKGISTHIPDHSTDFVLLCDYEAPTWVRDAVFYQIFPERFCNGDPANDVRDGEITQDGFASIHMNWDDTPPDYEHGHCLDFFGGDLQGIESKIPYFKRLGITALYLNPIFYAPSVHKYDCLDYFHVDPHFGGDEALASLSKALHENGIRLILDISINHTGTDHIWFNRDGTYFPENMGAYHNPASTERGFYFFNSDNSYHGWWDLPSMPTLNYTSDALRERVYRAQDSVLKKWLKEPYCIDGWRFDVADVFGRNGLVQLSHELWPEIRKSIKEENPQAYILAEDWGDCAQYMQGHDWDSPMNYYGCARVIRSFLGESDLFMRRDPELMKVRCNMRAEDVKARVYQHLARMPYALWGNQFNLFDSHDVPRLHNNPELSAADIRAAVLYQYTLPGAPSVYYGDEAAIDGIYGTNEGCRYPMPWNRDFEDSDSFRFYQRMNAIRTEFSCLRRGGFVFLHARGDVFAMARFTDDEAVVTVISKSSREEHVTLPLHFIGAAAPAAELTGHTLVWKPADEGVELLLQPHGSLIFSCRMRED